MEPNRVAGSDSDDKIDMSFRLPAHPVVGIAKYVLIHWLYATLSIHCCCHSYSFAKCLVEGFSNLILCKGSPRMTVQPWSEMYLSQCVFSDLKTRHQEVVSCALYVVAMTEEWTIWFCNPLLRGCRYEMNVHLKSNRLVVPLSVLSSPQSAPGML